MLVGMRVPQAPWRIRTVGRPSRVNRRDVRALLLPRFCAANVNYGRAAGETSLSRLIDCGGKSYSPVCISEPLRRARERILALGGLQAGNSYVKINLSLFGLYPRKHAPSVPPEITLLPCNVLYEMS